MKELDVKLSSRVWGSPVLGIQKLTLTHPIPDTPFLHINTYWGLCFLGKKIMVGTWWEYKKSSSEDTNK